MDMQEPKIIAPGYSPEELFGWLKNKVSAVQQLNALHNEKYILEERLEAVNSEVAAISCQAAMEVQDGGEAIRQASLLKVIIEETVSELVRKHIDTPR